MNRYLLKFEKKGALGYISHLDLIRLFRRTFKRVGIDLKYTKGFNPHPIMSFAQPLSLGYTSIGEYLEFETTIPQNESMMIGLLNSAFPYGITALCCHPLSQDTKSIASLVGFADYAIGFQNADVLPTMEQLSSYMKEDTIIVSKPGKKGKGSVRIDIKSMIEKLSIDVDEEGNRTIFARIHTGSRSNLNPELMLVSLFDYCNLAFCKGMAKIERLEIYDLEMTPLHCIDI